VLDGETASITTALLNTQVILGAATTLTDRHVRDRGLNVT
jgi:hypothetical protein